MVFCGFQVIAALRARRILPPAPFATSRNVDLRGVDLVTAPPGHHVVGAGFDGGIQHGVVGSDAAVRPDDAGVIEHEGDQAGFAEIAAGLGEHRTDVGGWRGCRIVGQGLPMTATPPGSIARSGSVAVFAVGT